MDTTESSPIYLVVDVGAPASSTHKRDMVDWILDGLRKAPPAVADTPLRLVLFAEEIIVFEERRLRDLGHLTNRHVGLGEGRDFGAAFDRVREAHRKSGRAGAYGSSGDGPWVVFVTDGYDTADWQPAFDRLVQHLRPVVVPVVYGVADPTLAVRLESAPGLGPKIPRRAEIASCVVEAVLNCAVPKASPSGGAAAPLPPGRQRSEEPTMRIDPHASGGHARGRTAVATQPDPGGSGDLDDDRTVDIAALAPPPERQPPTPDDPRAARADEPESPEWTGSFTPYVVGKAGRASEVRPLPAAEEWDWRDTVCDGVTILDADKRPLLDLRAASVRGSSHRYYGTVRQDDYSYRHTDDGRFVVCAVSDGVSSGSLSHRAATFVTRRGCELVAQILRTDEPADIDWSTVVGELAKGVIGIGTKLLEREESDASTVTPRDVAERMAATVVFAVVDVRGDELAFPVHVCAVGDSAAWMLRGGAEWDPLTAVKNEGKLIASSQTPALPMVPSEPLVPVATALAPDDVLVLMTDGIGDALLDGTGPVGRFLAANWRTPPVALGFAAQVDFLRQTHDDDRTAVAVWSGRSR